MPSKQMEQYIKETQEANDKIATYKDFQKQCEQIKNDSAKRIKSFKQDMKSLAKQILEINKHLKSQNQPIVEFKEVK